MGKLLLGADDYRLFKDKQIEPVYWDTDKSINAHGMIVGITGAGKTHTIRSIVDQYKLQTNARIHVFDVHGDIRIDGESRVRFSESTHYGLNPLALNTDPHYGGVRKRIQSFIFTLNSTSRQLGPKQESVLRCLMEDLYEMRGFKLNDPDTWHEEPVTLSVEDAKKIYLDIPFEQKDIAKSLAAKTGVSLGFDRERKCWFTDRYNPEFDRWPIKTFGKTYPTLDDLISFTYSRLKTLYMGSDQAAMNALDMLNRKKTALRAKDKKLNSGAASLMDTEEKKKLEDDIAKLKTDTVTAYKNYVDNISTGRELDNILRYSTHDVIKSVYDRLTNLRGTGIFKAVPPPHKPTDRVWVNDIQPLGVDEQRMFVEFYLQDLFLSSKQKGEQEEIQEVVVLDESHIFFNADPQNILNKLAKESRKYGYSMLCASQLPNHFSDDFLAAVAVKIILGIDDGQWDFMIRKMKMNIKTLDYIVAQQKIAVQIRNKGVLKTGFRHVNVQKSIIERIQKQASTAAVGGMSEY